MALFIITRTDNRTDPPETKVVAQTTNEESIPGLVEGYVENSGIRNTKYTKKKGTGEIVGDNVSVEVFDKEDVKSAFEALDGPSGKTIDL